MDATKKEKDSSSVKATVIALSTNSSHLRDEEMVFYWYSIFYIICLKKLKLISDLHDLNLFCIFLISKLLLASKDIGVDYQ